MFIHPTNMKKAILLQALLTLLLTNSATAQLPAVTVYVYAQESVKGIKPTTEVAESSSANPTKEIKPSTSSSLAYFAYLTYGGKAKLQVTGIWINGKAYNVKTEPITKTPVTIPQENSQEIILVPATKNKVILISPASLIAKPAKLMGAKKKAVESGRVVVVYIVNGIKYYKAIDKINILETKYLS